MLALAAAALLVPGAVAVGTALGFGSATTGGGSATAATPTSTAQLLSWLSDSTARVIVLTSVFDFTNYYGTTTGSVCSPWTCTNGNTPQQAINANDWCTADGAPVTGTATYYKSGTAYGYELKVGSNKTLLGKGSSAGIKGIGLLIQGASNVIIQNIMISDINAKYVWGGDALTIVGSDHIWIDHNYFKNVGRQFIVTGYDPAKAVTISNNIFDGRTSYSATCNGEHYWAVFFTGTSDTITFNLNHIYYTSGRGPHVGGTSGYTQYVHIVNNYFNHIDGHAIDAEVGAVVLAEGNYFNAVTTPSLTGSNSVGNEYFVQSSSDVSSCTSGLGRACQANTLGSSGTVASRLNSTVLTALKAQSYVTGYTPMTASAAATYVQANAGLGKVN